ncbi:filament-like plant protein 4 [Dorcoceras hygrometricum]|uniref:Filament-like plant protein 4 n=1 Tax=Dorcoceras hygrometricum TaxID=472368 RepID=A0A2Z7A5X7_9LAMI|nr:filament-like plant protein 4 [Dorcoceras hygrometricum]
MPVEVERVTPVYLISLLGSVSHYERKLIDSVLADDLDEVSEWIKWTRKYINQLEWSKAGASKQLKSGKEQNNLSYKQKRGSDAELLKNILKMKSNQLDKDTSWRTRSGQDS